MAPAPIFSINFIRELRGSPLTVLVAIILLEQSGQVPVTAQLLKDVTGYKDHTITDSLRMLESPTIQSIRRVVNGWRIAQGFQLPLEIVEKNRDIREFGPTTTTRYEGRIHLLSPVAGEEAQNRDIRDFSPDQKTIHFILKTQGLVGEPMCTRLALMDGIDPIFVLAHCAKAAMENTETGLLIHRIKYHDHIEETYRRRAQEYIGKLDLPDA
ncbi:MAG: hypothetical protein D4R70_00110 [Betaproteobacteria bacterium]|nr:MAG: hypothetical protein D4R70_00110 [Betaproteobacteria bacterium]